MVIDAKTTEWSGALKTEMMRADQEPQTFSRAMLITHEKSI